MPSFFDDLKRPFLVLAPMDDVTDTVFRRLLAEYCEPPDIFFTEFVNVDALQSAGRTSALRRLKFTSSERPLIAQIWGKQPENFYKTASELVEMGFSGVDINMGCPDKSVVKNGCGGGMIQYPERALEVINATRDGLAGKLPLSVKTRIGFSSYDPAWIEELLKQKLNMLSIHFRTVKEMSKVPAHWELAPQIVALKNELSPDTLLVGNGDVASYEQAVSYAEKYSIDGVMIGRGVFHDPFVFKESSPWENMSPSSKLDLFKSHVTLFESSWRPGEKPLAPLNKFCKIYINGFASAKEYREKLMSCISTEELFKTINEIELELAALAV